MLLLQTLLPWRTDPLFYSRYTPLGFNFPLLNNGLQGPPNDAPPPTGWILAPPNLFLPPGSNHTPFLCSLLAQSPCLLSISTYCSPLE